MAVFHLRHWMMAAFCSHSFKEANYPNDSMM